MAAVPPEGYVLAEEQGEMYFCNARCLCLWAVHFVTNPRRSEEQKEQQTYVLQHQFVMLNKIPQLRGVTPWILMDFRSPGRNIPKLQDGYNRKGIISQDGKKKQSFELVQEVYKEHSVGKPE
jgi:beta-glucuronidase